MTVRFNEAMDSQSLWTCRGIDSPLGRAVLTSPMSPTNAAHGSLRGSHSQKKERPELVIGCGGFAPVCILEGYQRAKDEMHCLLRYSSGTKTWLSIFYRFEHLLVFDVLLSGYILNTSRWGQNHGLRNKLPKLLHCSIKRI